jgi:hypothetical protein
MLVDDESESMCGMNGIPQMADPADHSSMQNSIENVCR